MLVVISCQCYRLILAVYFSAYCALYSVSCCRVVSIVLYFFESVCFLWVPISLCFVVFYCLCYSSSVCSAGLLLLVIYSVVFGFLLYFAIVMWCYILYF